MAPAFRAAATSPNVNSIAMPTCLLNDTIILFVSGETSNHPTLIADTALLTWTKIATAQNPNNAGFNTVGDVYVAISNGTLTGETIAVTRGGLNGRLNVMTVSGVNNVVPLDSDGSNPVTATASGSATLTMSGLSTNNPNTMLVAWCRADQTAAVLSGGPSGYVQAIASGSFVGHFYKIVSATQASVSAVMTFASSSANSLGVLLAIQSSAQPQPYFNRMIGGM